MFNPTQISCGYWCATCVSVFNLRHPREFTSTHIPKGNLAYIYTNVLSWPFGSVFFSGPGSFLVLSAPWHAGSPPGPLTQVGALAEGRGTCSGGSKWHVHSRRHSEHVEPSRSMQTHVHIYVINRLKNCPAFHVIPGILNVINVVRHWHKW